MFLMPVILFGALAAVIPLVVHMLRRQRVEPVEWGAMQFLLETPIRSRRRQHIDHWALMLVRMGMLLALVLLLARPMWYGWNPVKENVAGTVDTDIAVVVDHSLSMGRRSGEAGSLFDQALEQVDRIAGIATERSTISVVLAEHSPKVVTPLPILLSKKEGQTTSGEWTKVREGLRAVRPGVTEANIPEAILAAKELLARGKNSQKVIVVLSDEQRGNWMVGDEGAWRAALGDRADATAAGKLPIYVLPVMGSGGGANLAVTALDIQPTFLGVNRPSQILATVSNSGTAAVPNVLVKLLIDGRVVNSQQIASLPAGQAVTIPFDHYFTEAGSHWVKVQVEAVDGLEIDNSRVAAVNVAPRLKVLLVDGQVVAPASVSGYRNAQFLLAAMQPVENASEAATLIEPRVISVSDLAGVSLDEYSVVILNDVPRMPTEQVTRLAEYVQRGNAAMVILGPRTQRAFLADVLAKSPLLPATVGGLESSKEGSGVDIREPRSAALVLLTAAERNALAGVSIREWWKIVPASADTRVLIATSGGSGGVGGGGGGDPLVLETAVGKAGGRVVTWTTSADGAWNNLPLVPNFVPLLSETLFHLASGSAQLQVRALEAGQTLVWTGPSVPAVDGVQLTLPDGVVRNLPAQLRGDVYLFSYAETVLPGLYELRFAPQTIPQPVYYSVGLDARELDPAVVSQADAEWLRERNYVTGKLNAETLPTIFAARAVGTELWIVPVILLLGLMFAELLMTRRLVRSQTDIKPEVAGLVTRAGGGLR